MPYYGESDGEDLDGGHPDDPEADDDEQDFGWVGPYVDGMVVDNDVGQGQLGGSSPPTAMSGPLSEGNQENALGAQLDPEGGVNGQDDADIDIDEMDDDDVSEGDQAKSLGAQPDPEGGANGQVEEVDFVLDGMDDNDGEDGEEMMLEQVLRDEIELFFSNIGADILEQALVHKIEKLELRARYDLLLAASRALEGLDNNPVVDVVGRIFSEIVSLVHAHCLTLRSFSGEACNNLVQLLEQLSASTQELDHVATQVLRGGVWGAFLSRLGAYLEVLNRVRMMEEVVLDGGPPGRYVHAIENGIQLYGTGLTQDLHNWTQPRGPAFVELTPPGPMAAATAVASTSAAVDAMIAFFEIIKPPAGPVGLGAEQ